MLLILVVGGFAVCFVVFLGATVILTRRHKRKATKDILMEEPKKEVLPIENKEASNTSGYCSNCGEKISSNEKFCHKCGNPIKR